MYKKEKLILFMLFYTKNKFFGGFAPPIFFACIIKFHFALWIHKNIRFPLIFRSSNYNINKMSKIHKSKIMKFTPPLWNFLYLVWLDPLPSDNPLFPPPNADQLLHVCFCLYLHIFVNPDSRIPWFNSCLQYKITERVTRIHGRGGFEGVSPPSSGPKKSWGGGEGVELFEKQGFFGNFRITEAFFWCFRAFSQKKSEKNRF